MGWKSIYNILFTSQTLPPSTSLSLSLSLLSLSLSLSYGTSVGRQQLGWRENLTSYEIGKMKWSWTRILNPNARFEWWMVWVSGDFLIFIAFAGIDKTLKKHHIWPRLGKLRTKLWKCTCQTGSKSVCQFFKTVKYRKTNFLVDLWKR